MSGPPPKPTRLKLLEGNPGKQKLNLNEPRPDVPRRMDPPRWLGQEGRREFRRVFLILRDLGLITLADRAALSMYAVEWETYVGLCRDIKAEGISVMTSKGTPIVNPKLWARGKVFAALRGMLAEFGLSPAQRCKLQAPPAAEVDEFEEFLRQQNRA